MSAEIDGVTHHYAHLNDVLMHYVVAGKGPPVVLLHGWPQTWWEWRKVIPALTAAHTVIVPDMRGLGDSSRPLDGYDKRTVAGDIWKLVGETLGHERFFLVGHDWGGPVAYALAAEHPKAVRRLVILDGIPGYSENCLSRQRMPRLAGGGGFNRRIYPACPAADQANAEAARTRAQARQGPGEADIREYLRTYRQPGAMRAGFAYYRALEQDAADNRAFLARGKLPMPVLAMGGAVTYPHGRGRGAVPAESLKAVALNVRGEVVPDCGHFIPEEAPDLLSARLLAFFAEEDGPGSAG